MEQKVRVADGKVQIYDFCQTARFAEPDWPADITESICGLLKDVHPSMVIGFGAIAMKLYHVRYTYRTGRGNDREGTKYLFLPETDDINKLEGYELDVMVEGILQRNIDDYNRKYPYRAISNVQILGVEPLANAKLAIG